ncbi:hypothetical protein ACA910_011791 [Epithemia clementina (nom. ined.)]
MAVTTTSCSATTMIPPLEGAPTFSISSSSSSSSSSGSVDGASSGPEHDPETSQIENDATDDAVTVAVTNQNDDDETNPTAVVPDAATTVIPKPSDRFLSNDQPIPTETTVHVPTNVEEHAMIHPSSIHDNNPSHTPNNTPNQKMSTVSQRVAGSMGAKENDESCVRTNETTRPAPSETPQQDDSRNNMMVHLEQSNRNLCYSPNAAGHHRPNQTQSSSSSSHKNATADANHGDTKPADSPIQLSFAPSVVEFFRSELRPLLLKEAMQPLQDEIERLKQQNAALQEENAKLWYQQQQQERRQNHSIA